jgi:hypothetical protein
MAIPREYSQQLTNTCINDWHYGGARNTAEVEGDGEQKAQG